MRRIGLMGLMLLLLVGCAAGAPPSSFERAIYNFTTQHVEVITFRTNYTTVVSPAGQTNIGPVTVTAETNWVEMYDRLPKESVVSGIKAGGAVATTFGFGLGGVVALVVGGIYAGWATWKNARKNKAMAVLAQAVETGREIIKTTPQGQSLEENYIAWLKQNQRTAGVIALVGAVVEENVDNAAAKAAAELLTRPARADKP